ncbi:hypothetical protein [Aureitalea marina]|uniref:hypothetical protein n=1 Tax=Aureitalea marina TaxID=930804 RepID=UPI0011B02E19|nr:hypothetical protein [Aureitalea marina]
MVVEVIVEYNDQDLFSGQYNPSELKVKKSQGRNVYEIVRLQDVFNFLVSPKVLAALELNGLSGWKSYGVQSDIELVGYRGFQCTGKCGFPVRPKQSGFVTGYEFDIETWDGSDFFIPESTMMIICTERAKQVLDKLNIKNIELENLRSHEWYNA